MKRLLVLFLLGFMILSLGCIHSGDGFVDDYNEEVKPRVQLLFQIYFGVGPDGKYRVAANEKAEGKSRGIQDVVFSKWDSFDKGEQKKLREANKKMIEALGTAKKIDDNIQKYDATKEKVVDIIVEVIKTAGTIASAT